MSEELPGGKVSDGGLRGSVASHVIDVAFCA